MLNPELKEGDRIVLIHMDGESNVLIGEKGTVKRVSTDPFEDDEMIYSVEWDNGSTLNLLSVTDSWIYAKDFKEKESLQEAVKLKNQSCSQFSIGSKFCDTLTGLLKNKGEVKKKSIDFFEALLKNIDLTGPGQKVKLEPGNPHFDERYEELVRFYNILKDSGQCQKMLTAIENDLESVKEKGLIMVVDNDDKYSLFNRLNTHYTNQAVILTKAILDSNKNWKSVNEIDIWKPEMVKSNIIDYLDPTPENLEHIDRIISTILNVERETSMMFGDFDYTKGMGDVVESEIAKAFREKGYEVFEFGADFGFVDHFVVDMVVMKDGKIHPVQASSMRKQNPKFFQFNEPNCKCWAVFPYGSTYRVETLLENRKMNESSIKQMDEWMSLQDIFRSGRGQKIFNFFEKVRQSGIVNMFASSSFIYSGGDYLRKFIEMEKYKGYEFDEDAIEELIELADNAKNEIIQMTIEVLENEGKEPTLENLNRKISKVAVDALRFFMMMYSHR